MAGAKTSFRAKGVSHSGWQKNTQHLVQRNPRNDFLKNNLSSRNRNRHPHCRQPRSTNFIQQILGKKLKLEIFMEIRTKRNSQHFRSKKITSNQMKPRLSEDAQSATPRTTLAKADSQKGPITWEPTTTDTLSKKEKAFTPTQTRSTESTEDIFSRQTRSSTSTTTHRD